MLYDCDAVELNYFNKNIYVVFELRRTKNLKHAVDEKKSNITIKNANNRNYTLKIRNQTNFKIKNSYQY